MSMRITIRCPHCNSKSNARTSKELTSTLREITYACWNVNCGHTFVSQLEVVRTLSPSALPNPRISLPISPRTCHLVMEQMQLCL